MKSLSHGLGAQAMAVPAPAAASLMTAHPPVMHHRSWPDAARAAPASHAGAPVREPQVQHHAPAARHYPDVSPSLTGLAREYPDVSPSLTGLAREYPDVSPRLTGLARHYPDVTPSPTGLARCYADVVSSGPRFAGDPEVRRRPRNSSSDIIGVECECPELTRGTQAAARGYRDIGFAGLRGGGSAVGGNGSVGCSQPFSRLDYHTNSGLPARQSVDGTPGSDLLKGALGERGCGFVPSGALPRPLQHGGPHLNLPPHVLALARRDSQEPVLPWNFDWDLVLPSHPTPPDLNCSPENRTVYYRSLTGLERNCLQRAVQIASIEVKAFMENIYGPEPHEFDNFGDPLTAAIARDRVWEDEFFRVLSGLGGMLPGCANLATERWIWQIISATHGDPAFMVRVRIPPVYDDIFGVSGLGVRVADFDIPQTVSVPICLPQIPRYHPGPVLVEASPFLLPRS